jgi:hypothetical protein
MSWREIRDKESDGRFRKRQREFKHLQARGEDEYTQIRRMLDDSRRIQEETEADLAELEQLNRRWLERGGSA